MEKRREKRSIVGKPRNVVITSPKEHKKVYRLQDYSSHLEVGLRRDKRELQGKMINKLFFLLQSSVFNL